MQIRIDPEFKALIPPLSAYELSQLEANIVSDGCRDPLVVWGIAEVLVDGHNRYEICTRLGIEFKTVELDFYDSDDAKLWIIKNQLGRRNLPKLDAATLLTELRAIEARRAKERKQKGRPVAGEHQVNLPDDTGQTRDRVAAMIDVSGSTLESLDKINESGTPELKHAVRTNKISADLGSQIANESPEEQLSLLGLGEKKVIIKAVKEKKKQARDKKRKEHAEKVELAAAGSVDKIEGPFDLILADPPWQYDHQESENRAIENHYATAGVDEIVKHIPQSSDDSILLLWATAPKLSEALEVLAAWGFSYKTHAIWDKQKVGMGYWFRGQHELLLVGVKGNPGATPECERRSSIFSESRGKHSKKPECVYEWIESAFPDKKKLEMYCRSPRSGWASWGNEV